jgi:hypothetical protein
MSIPVDQIVRTVRQKSIDGVKTATRL